jgi:hypothetical protein
VDTFTEISTWAALSAGVVVLGLGVATLVRKRVFGFATKGRAIQWRPYAWAQTLVAAFILVETVPRLAGAPSGVVVVMSFVAFVPLAGGVAAQRRALAT